MSKKISSFVVDNAVTDSSLITYVKDGQNYTVTQSEYVKLFGVAGSLAQDGSVTGTPVLDVQGSVNNIRNLEDGSGVKSSVSAQNGITLAHNFAQDTTGAAILGDITATQPTFASLEEGTGIDITKTGNSIKITATGALPATKVVPVNDISDFPAAVSGVITLEDNTVYVISNDVSTADRFVMGSSTVVEGYAAFGPALTYTGSGTMFTGVDVTCSIYNVKLTCTSGKVFEFSDTVGGIQTCSFTDVLITACATIGTFNNLRTAFVQSLSALNVTSQGINFIGSNYVLIAAELFSVQSSNASFVALDFGTSVSETIRIREGIFNGVSGAVGITGAASNANLNATGRAEITECTFTAPVNAVTVIDVVHDVNWRSINNQNLSDTRPDSMSYNTAGTTSTIAGAGTPVRIAGTWIDDNSAHFTVDGSGLVTYIGLDELHVPIDVSVTADPVSGSNKDFAISIGINGTSVAASAAPARASTSDKISVSTFWQYPFNTGDTVEVMIQNDTDTTNFNVSHGLLRVN